jgi:hypothetical protein
MVPEDIFPATLPMFAATDVFMAVAVDKANEDGRMSRRERKAIARLERNGWLARHSTTRAMERYRAEGGEETTGQGFFQWLVANWETILQMIMQIVGLFGGGAAADMVEPVGERALFGIDGEAIARKILDVVREANRVGAGVEASVQAFITAVYGVPSMPLLAPSEMREYVTAAARQVRAA